MIARLSVAAAVVVAYAAVAAATIPASEKEALVDLFTATNGKAWVASDSWLTGTDPCLWCVSQCCHTRLAVGCAPGAFGSAFVGRKFNIYGVCYPSFQCVGGVEWGVEGVRAQMRI